MKIMVQVSLCEAARVPAGTKLYVDVSGSVAVQEGSDPDEKPFRSCLLTTEIGTWHVQSTAEDLMRLIVESTVHVAGRNSTREKLAVMKMTPEPDEIDKVIAAVTPSDN